MGTNEKIQKREEVRRYIRENYGYKDLRNVGDFFYGEIGGSTVLEALVERIKEDCGLDNLSLFVNWQEARCNNAWGATFCGTKEQAAALQEAFGGTILWGGIGWTITKNSTPTEGNKFSFEQVLEVLF